MKVSLITGTFNSASTIRFTLESVALQTFQEMEHIIIDGGSTDDTIEILKEYPYISQIVSEPDDGIYDAMNKGIQLATGDIVGILNSDDFYANRSVVQQIVKSFQSDPSLEAIYGDLNYVEKIQTNRIVRRWKAKSYNPKKWLYGWMPPHPTFYVRREVYEKYGTFNLQLNSSADYELMLRLLYKHEIKVKYLPTTIVHMRTGGHSNVSIRNRLSANKEDGLAWEINELKPYPFTTFLKPVRKLKQYVVR